MVNTMLVKLEGTQRSDYPWPFTVASLTATRPVQLCEMLSPEVLATYSTARLLQLVYQSVQSVCTCMCVRDIRAAGGVVVDSIHLIGQWVIICMFCVISYPNYSVYVNFCHCRS